MMKTSIDPGNACFNAAMSGPIMLPMMLVPEDPCWMKTQPAGLKPF